MKTLRFGCTSAAAALALAAAATVTAQPDPRINEIRIDQPSTDNDEYFELAGTPDTSLLGVSYIVIGDDATAGSGYVEEWVLLSAESIGPTGYFVAAENTFSFGIPDLYTDLNFENTDNVTHLIVMNFTGQVGDDLDFDDDGILDLTPWDSIIDCVAVVGPGTPGVDGDHIYCASQVGPNGPYVPGQVYRCDPDLTWTVGEFNLGITDTPGTVNTSCDFIPPCGSYLAGSCFEPNGTPNCSDETCCISVCGQFPSCCSVAWDQLCADFAQIECRQCGDADAGSCYEANGTAYCDDLECCTTVCAIDPSCCQLNGWVQTCADLAQINCLSCGDPGAGSCFEPNGTAYCNLESCCTIVCGIDPTCCELNGWDQICADLALANCPQTAVEKDDIALGLSFPDPAATLMLLRGDAVLNGGTVVEDAWAQPYMQSMEFDNLDGIPHNAQGNLLGVNFGTAATGGSIYSLPTCEAFGPGQLIGDTVGLGGAGLTLSRLCGLSVSPDNTKIAVVGYDSQEVIVYDYLAGDCHGAGAALSGARETAQMPMCDQDTQGTAWLDDNTVLAFSSLGTIVAVDATAMTASVVANVTGSCPNGYTDIEYNPLISPYVFATDGAYSGGTVNTLWVLDPDNSWAIVNGPLDYSGTINTTREIAFDSAGNLFVSQYSSGGVNIDFIPDAAADAAILVGNDSIDWITVGSASFPGFDVAAGGGAPPCPWDCQPAPNGGVDVSDFLALLAQWGQVGTSCDFDDPSDGVGVTDFLAILAHWGPCP